MRSYFVVLEVLQLRRNIGMCYILYSHLIFSLVVMRLSGAMIKQRVNWVSCLQIYT